MTPEARKVLLSSRLNDLLRYEMAMSLWALRKTGKIWVSNVTHQLMYLITWFPDCGTIWKCCKVFKRQLGSTSKSQGTHHLWLCPSFRIEFSQTFNNPPLELPAMPVALVDMCQVHRKINPLTPKFLVKCLFWRWETWLVCE